MKMYTHGGQCCGIKTIFEMGYEGPDKITDALSALTEYFTDGTTNARRWFMKEAPRESKINRLDRYLEYYRKNRSAGICEIVIADNKKQPIYDQTVWIPLLEERGFKMVNSCKNSNSGNTVFVFHLDIGE